MSEKQQPARVSTRIAPRAGLTFETTAFAKRRDKRRQANKLAKASRKKNRR